jgi:hypothetical protein
MGGKYVNLSWIIKATECDAAAAAATVIVMRGGGEYVVE